MDRDKPSPFADMISALVWFALAAAIVVLSWQMDRLAHLQASIYSVPGLVPGILGAALAIMAAILFGRAVRAGALAGARLPAFRLAEQWRLLVALGLSLAFAIGLVGSGMPFWLASALYVAVFVFVFRLADSEGARAPWRVALLAAAYGAVMGLLIHYVFQDLFLVRLP